MRIVLKSHIRVGNDKNQPHMMWARLSVPQTSFSYGLNRRNYPPRGKLDLNWNETKWSKKKNDCGMRLTVEFVWEWNAFDSGMRLNVECVWPWNASSQFLGGRTSGTLKAGPASDPLLLILCDTQTSWPFVTLHFLKSRFSFFDLSEHINLRFLQSSLVFVFLL